MIRLEHFNWVRADAEMTGHLWVDMVEEVEDIFGSNHESFELIQKLSKIAEKKAMTFFARVAAK